jgi:hypothetical protein
MALVSICDEFAQQRPMNCLRLQSSTPHNAGYRGKHLPIRLTPVPYKPRITRLQHAQAAQDERHWPRRDLGSQGLGRGMKQGLTRVLGSQFRSAAGAVGRKAPAARTYPAEDNLHTPAVVGSPRSLVGDTQRHTLAGVGS